MATANHSQADCQTDCTTAVLASRGARTRWSTLRNSWSIGPGIDILSSSATFGGEISGEQLEAHGNVRAQLNKDEYGAIISGGRMMCQQHKAVKVHAYRTTAVKDTIDRASSEVGWGTPSAVVNGRRVAALLPARQLAAFLGKTLVAMDSVADSVSGLWRKQPRYTVGCRDTLERKRTHANRILLHLPIEGSVDFGEISSSVFLCKPGGSTQGAKGPPIDERQGQTNDWARAAEQAPTKPICAEAVATADAEPQPAVAATAVLRRSSSPVPPLRAAPLFASAPPPPASVTASASGAATAAALANATFARAEQAAPQAATTSAAHATPPARLLGSDFSVGSRTPSFLFCGAKGLLSRRPHEKGPPFTLVAASRRKSSEAHQQAQQKQQDDRYRMLLLSEGTAQQREELWRELQQLRRQKLSTTGLVGMESGSLTAAAAVEGEAATTAAGSMQRIAGYDIEDADFAAALPPGLPPLPPEAILQQQQQQEQQEQQMQQQRQLEQQKVIEELRKRQMQHVVPRGMLPKLTIEQLMLAAEKRVLPHPHLRLMIAGSAFVVTREALGPLCLPTEKFIVPALGASPLASRGAAQETAGDVLEAATEAPFVGVPIADWETFPWPHYLEGLHLGEEMEALRHERDLVEKELPALAKRLKELDFDWQLGASTVSRIERELTEFRLLLKALPVYLASKPSPKAAFRGPPVYFVVPSGVSQEGTTTTTQGNEPQYPPETAAFRLGAACSALRQRGRFLYLPGALERLETEGQMPLYAIVALQQSRAGFDGVQQMQQQMQQQVQQRAGLGDEGMQEMESVKETKQRQRLPPDMLELQRRLHNKQQEKEEEQQQPPGHVVQQGATAAEAEMEAAAAAIEEGAALEASRQVPSLVPFGEGVRTPRTAATVTGGSADSERDALISDFDFGAAEETSDCFLPTPPHPVKRRIGLRQRLQQQQKEHPLQYPFPMHSRRQTEGGYQYVFDLWSWDDVIEALQYFNDLYDPVAKALNRAVTFNELPADWKIPGENVTSLQSPWRTEQQQQEQAEEANLWPAQWWGMPLGLYVHQIRQGDVDARFHPRRRPVLDRLGFRWEGTEKYLNFTWMKLLKGVKWWMFFRQHPIVQLGRDAVIPPSCLVADVCKPEEVQGLCIGEIVYQARLQEPVLYHHYPQRYELFRQFGLAILPAERLILSYPKVETDKEELAPRGFTLKELPEAIREEY
ncbi:uncharacterized protein LOC34622932 [Cyclospora cayetanensis]|uniref:Uncharacterized protein LOC34622932 n=1 Tax=Cyclospora cayetanensis TaxID=88456 RepID=A0A6P6S406_9EIME|nr:uncharacterized protein LOC34622932 [Cyclospora cayetanensis]